MALLYGRTGRLTSKNGGFRPGQSCDRILFLERGEAEGDGARLAEQGTHQELVCRRPCLTLTLAIGGRVIHTPLRIFY